MEYLIEKTDLIIKRKKYREGTKIPASLLSKEDAENFNAFLVPVKSKPEGSDTDKNNSSKGKNSNKSQKNKN